MSHQSETLINSQLLVELFEFRIALVQSGRSLSVEDACRLATAYSIRFRRRYTLARVCRAWNWSRATLYRRRTAIRSQLSRHITPVQDSDVVAQLREWIAHTPFPAERHRKLWARLRHMGIFVSRERVRRLIRIHQLIPQPGVGIQTNRPDLMWGIDSTRVRTVHDGQAIVLLAVDHCTTECLAIDAVHEETTRAWLALIHKAIRYSETAGAIWSPRRTGISIRHDNLGLFRDRSFRAPLRKLNVRCSAIPPLYPQGNGCAERFVRTLRDNLLAIRGFPDIVSLRSDLARFQRTYNRDWLLTRWDYKTPQEVRRMLQTETIS